MRDAYTGSQKDIDDFNAVRETIIQRYPALRKAFENEIDTVGDLAGAYEDAIDWLEKYNEAKIRENYRNAHEGIDDARTSYNAARNRMTMQIQQNDWANGKYNALSS